MKITILNGEPDPASDFQNYLHALTRRLTTSGHAVTQFDLATLNLRGCSGCFGCFVKTPGECVKRDDSAQICRSAIGSDLLLLASPMTMGFTTALLKRAADQMIPLIHPYLEIQGGEVHHRARYANYPKFALLVDAGNSDAEDIQITTTMWSRMARDLKSSMVFTAVTSRAPEEVADEIAIVA
jgi:multimeric flavodoxin WrbA